MIGHEEVATAFNAAAKALGVDGKELGALLAFLATMSEKELAYLPIGNNEAIIEFVRSLQRSKSAAAGLGKESMTGAGVAYAGPSSSGGAAAVLREIVSPPRPSSVVCVSLSVFNDAPLASMLASHAQALSISGKVQHVSVKHTQYTLLFQRSSTEAEEKLQSFLKWVKERTPILVGGVQPPGNGPCCVLLVDPESCSEAELESCEADLISLLQTGRLAVTYASPQVQQAIEKLLGERERSERSSLHSLGRSGEQSANE